MQITKGDILIIEGNEYEATKVMREIDRYDSKSRKLVGQHMEIELSTPGQPKPSHLLKIYSEERVVLVKITETISRPEKGILFNYINGKNIPFESIKVKHK